MVVKMVKEAKEIDFSFPKLFSQLAIKQLKNLVQMRKWFMNEQQAKTRDMPTKAIVGVKLAISDCS